MIYNALVQRGGDTRGQVRANHLQPRDRADPESDSERGNRFCDVVSWI